MTPVSRVRLSSFDAFFVAFQEDSGIRMQLGSETDIRGSFTRDHFLAMLRSITDRWPQTRSLLVKRMTGLAWGDPVPVERMLSVSEDPSDMIRWRNLPIDPFREPPVQVLWIRRVEMQTLVFRVHHCVMDGEAFLKMCIHAAKALSAARAGVVFGDGQVESPGVIRVGELWSNVSLRTAWKYSRWLRKEAGRPSSARFEQRQCAPGDIDIFEVPLSPSLMNSLTSLYASTRLAPQWICCAAWMKTIRQWNMQRKPETVSRVAVEFPISLRRQAERRNAVGNLISPLVLECDADDSVQSIARTLEQQTVRQVRDRVHMVVPFLSHPGKYLPWSWYRRIAVNQTTSGFATTHFSWFEYREQPTDFFAEYSRGLLALITQRVYTPVCLHMGAALSALISAREPKLFITFRTTGFTREDVQGMASHMLTLIRGFAGTERSQMSEARRGSANTLSHAKDEGAGYARSLD